MKENSEYSERSSVVSSFVNKAKGGGYSRHQADPEVIKKMHADNAHLKALHRENKKRLK